MPFTPAHAAAALPFRRTRLPVAAIVLGTMSPDFLYFLRLTPKGRFGHTLLGILALDLPLSLLLLWLWKRYLSASLWAILGRDHRRSPTADATNPARFWLLAVPAILLGAATHVLWDSFTHSGFWPYHHIAFLSTVVSVPVLGEEMGFELLQQISSVVGLVIVGFWLREEYRLGPRGYRLLVAPAWRWPVGLSLLVATAAATLRSWMAVRAGRPPFDAGPLVFGRWIVTWMSTLFVLWLALSVVLDGQRLRSSSDAQRS